MNRSLSPPYRAAALACSLLIGLNLLKGALGVLVAGALIVAIGKRLGAPRVLLPIVVFGLPFLTATATLVGLTPTAFVIAINLILVLLVIRNLPLLLSRPSYRGVQRFLIWWFSFLLVYSIFSIIEGGSDYRVFTLQYLLIYGTFYSLAGVLVIRYEVSLFETMVVGLPLFAFHYWLLAASPISLSVMANPVIGLRGNEGFDPINGARTAGLMLLTPLIVFATERRNIRWVPEFGAAIVLSAPLVWYSYTRQVFVAVILVVLWMFALMMLSRRREGESLVRRLTALGLMCVIIATSALLVMSLLQGDTQSRLLQEGLETDRTVLWRASLALIADHPVIGAGIGEFQRRGLGEWPHNWFIEAWLVLGLPGLLLTIIGTVVFLNALLRRRHGWVAAWLPLGLYWLIVAQFSADIARNSQLFFFMAFGFYATAWVYQSPGVEYPDAAATRLPLRGPEPDSRR